MSRELVQAGIAILGVIGPTAWFFWQRYQALEQRLAGLDQRFTALDLKLVDAGHELILVRQGVQGQIEHHEYLIHSNTALVNHRTERFTTSLKAMEARLSRDVDEIKGFLDKTTEFKIRG
jgi:hypothetical protein